MSYVTRIEKIDDYTVRLEMDDPTPAIPWEMAAAGGGNWFCFQPKHYLKKWHIKYNPKADELAKEEGFENWWDCMYYHYWWAPQKDLDKPTLQPWILKKFTTTAKVFERNPYYWKVDTAGNQLPYIDKIVSTIVDPEVYQLKIISGETDVAYMKTRFENYPLYKENEDAGNYEVILIPGNTATEVGFGINQNHPDPALHKIYQDVRFRQALSVAINREEINDTAYFGVAVPRQVTVPPTFSYYKKEWGEAYAQYDPEEANRLLDEIGLTERDKNDFRNRPDGKTMLLVLNYTTGGEAGTPVTVLELVKEYWEKIGLKVLLKAEEASLYRERKAAGVHDITVVSWGGFNEIRAGVAGTDWVIGDADFAWAPAWGAWLKANDDVRIGRATLEDFEGGKFPGEEPPEEMKELFEWGELAAETSFGSKEYMELRQRIFDFHAENVLMIGTVGMAPFPYIAKKNIGNVPKYYRGTQSWRGDLSYDAEQMFFKD